VHAVAGCMVSIACAIEPSIAPGGAATASTSTTTSSTSTTSDTTDDASTTLDASTSSGSTSESGAMEAGAGFIEDPDGRHPEIECSILEEDCPRGEKCMPWANDGASSWNALRCFPIAPDPAGVGEPCTVVGSGVSGIDDCELHSMCWNVDPETDMGTCVAFCVGSENNPTCLDPNSRCVFGSDGVLMLCIPMCHPLEQDCLVGEVCVGGDEFSCEPDASGESGVPGDPCEYLNVCDPGLACVASESVPDCASPVGCCSAFCPIGDGSPCLPGQACLPWFEAGQAPRGYADVGICMLP
jgi:hypothetical protein